MYTRTEYLNYLKEELRTANKLKEGEVAGKGAKADALITEVYEEILSYIQGSI